MLVDAASENDVLNARTDYVSDPTGAVNATNGAITVAVLEERLAARDREIESYKSQLKDCEYRYHELLQQPPAGPAARARASVLGQSYNPGRS